MDTCTQYVSAYVHSTEVAALEYAYGLDFKTNIPNPELIRRSKTSHRRRRYVVLCNEHRIWAKIYVRILIALKGTVYNVTQGKAFYGPGGSYHIFAGRDASRGLAKMSLEVKDVDDPSIDDLNLSEIDAMNNWAEKLAAKYPIVGHLVVPMEERDYTLEELAQYNGKGWLICWFVGWLGWLGWLGCWSPKRAKKTSCLFVQCLVSYLCF